MEVMFQHIERHTSNQLIDNFSNKDMILIVSNHIDWQKIYDSKFK